MSAPTCSAASLAAGESLVGTAVESVDRWLLLEVTDTWAPKVLESDVISGPLRAHLAQWLEAPRTRLQLVRRPGRTGKRPFVMLTSSDGKSARLELEGLDDLCDVDLDGLDLEPTEPLVLVCVHGRRDRCCAQHGSAVYRALHGQGLDVWQASHLGGHRFAACVLSLPEGLMYGRMRPEHAPAFAEAAKAGEVGDLDLFRGRCTLDRPTQAAEVFVRQRGGNRAASALRWIDTTPDGDLTWTVRFRAPSGEQVIRVRREDTGLTRHASCGEPAEPVTRFVEL
jgi:hypothetical protein